MIIQCQLEPIKKELPKKKLSSKSKQPDSKEGKDLNTPREKHHSKKPKNEDLSELLPIPKAIPIIDFSKDAKSAERPGWDAILRGLDLSNSQAVADKWSKYTCLVEEEKNSWVVWKVDKKLNVKSNKLNGQILHVYIC